MHLGEFEVQQPNGKWKWFRFGWCTNTWASGFGFVYELIGENTHAPVNFTKTRAIVCVDEDEYGKPVTEKWVIRKLFFVADHVPQLISKMTIGKDGTVKQNPLTRIKRSEIRTKPSQATGDDPSERLAKRRSKTAKTIIPGVYANPLTRVEIMSNSQRERINPKTGKPTKRPNARLIKRRTITESLPPGYYANPVDPAEFRDTTSYGTKATANALRARVKKLTDTLKLSAGFENGSLNVEKNYNGYRLIQITDSGRGLDRNLSGILSAGELLCFLDGALLVAQAVK